jgi:AmiR/NasT family two-component response regulator
MKNVLIGLLRQDQEDLTPAETAAIEEKFPDCEIVYVRADPKDCVQHKEWCDEHKPDVVVLPKERPIPSMAMEAGFKHIVLTPVGAKQLEPLVPTFCEFIPEL